MLKLLGRVLRLGESKKLQDLQVKAEMVNEWESRISGLSDTELTAKTDEFRIRYSDGETLEDMLPEAFAVVREAAQRTLGMRHFDVQIMGGVVLFEGQIAEMKTGEGKTLVATLAVYLEAISGKGVHVVTVNDYLAKRDSDWMGKVYRFLGLRVGLLQNMMDQDDRVAAYKADVIYGTNSEFGFDYLRDNMATDPQEIVQRGHNFAIVDEVDSILIDEARTPLIISGEPEKAADTYRTFARIMPKLREGVDYEVDDKTRTVAATEEGVAKVEKALNIDNLYNDVNSQLVNHLNQALRAQAIYRRDVDYVVQDGEVLIVDEFTGRLMVGRRYSEGLHQAIEAKEAVPIKEENQTLATITLQNYFRMYDKLAGMTGTAATEAEEFRHIYKLETVVVPSNQPMVRIDNSDIIYKTEAAKFKAVVEDICERHKSDQPVLVGTVSIENSEKLAAMLKKQGVPHEVLNAKHHEREAEIVAQAGRKGAVTIATNMAGRGTDIVLGGSPADPQEAELVVAAGGLHVLGTERHESRRIDNQLRGRSGRQGDPGSSQFYLSLEDSLMRIFGSERISSIMDRLGLPDDIPIEHKMVSRSIETAQRQIEAQNFEIRKRVLEYDDVMNQQRKMVYEQRLQVLFGEDIDNLTRQLVSDSVARAVAIFASEETYPEDWDWEGLGVYLGRLAPVTGALQSIDHSHATPADLSEVLEAEFTKVLESRRDQFGAEMFEKMQRYVLLQVVDIKWREHLYEMDYLQEGIHLRALGQRDPLIEYKNEGFKLFNDMSAAIQDDYVSYLYHSEVVTEEFHQPQMQFQAASIDGDAFAGAPVAEVSRAPVTADAKVGRNDPCPCGSGKKYKKCHGK